MPDTSLEVVEDLIGTDALDLADPIKHVAGFGVPGEYQHGCRNAT